VSECHGLGLGLVNEYGGVSISIVASMDENQIEKSLMDKLIGDWIRATTIEPRKLDE